MKVKAKCEKCGEIRTIETAGKPKPGDVVCWCENCDWTFKMVEEIKPSLHEKLEAMETVVVGL